MVFLVPRSPFYVQYGLSLAILALPVSVRMQAGLERAHASGREEEHGSRNAELKSISHAKNAKYAKGSNYMREEKEKKLFLAILALPVSV
ncbi:MAG: hypothetical protein U9Q94_01670, partial [Candidatus Bipolaricaulota bacterium]|nr:hypothetical protein [Candidatus Bipolaricaulota bacterium]